MGKKQVYKIFLIFDLGIVFIFGVKGRYGVKISNLLDFVDIILFFLGNFVLITNLKELLLYHKYF